MLHQPLRHHPYAPEPSMVPSAESAKPRRKPVRLAYGALPALFAAGDAAIIVGSGLFSEVAVHQLMHGHSGDPGRSLGLGLLGAVLFVAILNHQRIYDEVRGLGLFDHAKAAISAWAMAVALLAVVIVLLKLGEDVSRAALVTHVLGAGLGLVLWRVAVKRLARRFAVAGARSGPRVAVLASPGRRDLEAVLGRLGRYGYSVSRLFYLPRRADRARRGRGVVEALIAHVREQEIDEVLVVGSWATVAGRDGAALRAALGMIAVPVKLIPDAELARAMTHPSCDVGASRALVLKPAALTPPQQWRKRAFDILASAALLTALAPLLAVIALLIRLDSPGPAFFRQWRGGYNGHRFRIFKFRTMRVMEDGPALRQASADDPRVTRIGRLLRKSSLDELPQLINVLLGDMSLVGPRPHAIAHDETYARLIAPYPARHHVKPGITGWAQVNGCRGETREVALMKERVELDIAYIQRWSLSLDLLILLLTARELARPRNAH